MLAADRALIALAEHPRITDSLDLDEAMRPAYPMANRWDYLLGVANKEIIVAVEPHTATDREVRVLISKKAQAIAFLRDHLRPGRSVARWIWIAHGRVGFTRMDRAIRQLDQNGIQFQGRILKSLD